MGKVKKATKVAKQIKSAKTTSPSAPPLDPTLTALFNSSTPRAPPSPVEPSRGSSKVVGRPKRSSNAVEDAANGISSSDENDSDPGESVLAVPVTSKKRKRASNEYEIEARYLQKLALEEEKEDLARKRQREEANPQLAHVEAGSSADQQQERMRKIPREPLSEAQPKDSSQAADEERESDDYQIPQHESLSKTDSTTEVDKANRTIFLGNVSTEAIKSKSSKRVLLEHLVSFTTELDDPSTQKVESIRFRSTAFSDSSIPKKAAFAKHQLMDATTKSTNAYVVYSTPTAAREATKRLNGTVILNRHLRVDSVAHPSAIDHRRCVFVGNLGFVDDESIIRANEAEDESRRPKAKAAADIEEGLWIHFGKVGPVESVRVIRDRTTRVGKGIAYVQFKDPNSVEKALLMNEKKFPPMLPRKLRVTRAKKVKKNAAGSQSRLLGVNSKGMLPSGKPAKLSTLAGRADRMLGKAGAHHLRKRMKLSNTTFKSPETIVFEGHRAVPSGRGISSKKDGSKKKRDRRTDRSKTYRSRAGRTPHKR